MQRTLSAKTKYYKTNILLKSKNVNVEKNYKS